MYNVADEKGYLENRPSWLGSWLLMPISLAQLFHAFVFDRETTPKVGHTILLFFFFFGSYAYAIINSGLVNFL